eukprot:gene20319-1065_t
MSVYNITPKTPPQPAPSPPLSMQVPTPDHADESQPLKPRIRSDVVHEHGSAADTDWSPMLLGYPFVHGTVKRIHKLVYKNLRCQQKSARLIHSDHVLRPDDSLWDCGIGPGDELYLELLDPGAIDEARPQALEESQVMDESLQSSVVIMSPQRNRRGKRSLEVSIPTYAIPSATITTTTTRPAGRKRTLLLQACKCFADEPFTEPQKQQKHPSPHKHHPHAGNAGHGTSDESSERLSKSIRAQILNS